jgi:hypothetical protein
MAIGHKNRAVCLSGEDEGCSFFLDLGMNVLFVKILSIETHRFDLVNDESGMELLQSR